MTGKKCDSADAVRVKELTKVPVDYTYAAIDYFNRRLRNKNKENASIAPQHQNSASDVKSSRTSHL